MGKSAQSKLDFADDLDKKAARLNKRDSESSRELRELARKQRKSAIKQLKRRPKRKRNISGGLIGG